MSRLIAIIGNAGVGKTTLARALADATGAALALERLEMRPFQALMQADPARFALANQVDFLLARAAQERELRRSAPVGIVDGGLDLDFHGFTRLFHARGYLTDGELALLGRLYRTLRAYQPPPEGYVYLTAPVAVARARLARRGRAVEIARSDDLVRLEALIAGWMGREREKGVVVTVDASADDFCSPQALLTLRAQLPL